MLAVVEEGDIIVTVKIDRLGRTAADTLQAINKLKEMKLSVVIIQLGTTDMTSSAGKLLLTMLAAVAEMERDMLVERIHAGLERTKEQGTKLGPPLKLEPEVLQEMINERKSGKKLQEIALKHKVHTSLVDRNIKRWEGKMPEYHKEFQARGLQYKVSMEKNAR